MAEPARREISDPEVRFHLVHAVPGRTRMRVDTPHQLDELVAAIEAFFRDHPGLQEIRANRDCQSVVVTYDPDLCDVRHLPFATEREVPPWWAGWNALRSAATRLIDDAFARTADALASARARLGLGG